MPDTTPVWWIVSQLSTPMMSTPSRASRTACARP
jgi:hypothetical protein